MFIEPSLWCWALAGEFQAASALAVCRRAEAALLQAVLPRRNKFPFCFPPKAEIQARKSPCKGSAKNQKRREEIAPLCFIEEQRKRFCSFPFASPKLTNKIKKKPNKKVPLWSWKAPLWAALQPCRIPAPSPAAVQLEQRGCACQVPMEGSVPNVTASPTRNPGLKNVLLTVLLF